MIRRRLKSDGDHTEDCTTNKSNNSKLSMELSDLNTAGVDTEDCIGGKHYSSKLSTQLSDFNNAFYESDASNVLVNSGEILFTYQ